MPDRFEQRRIETEIGRTSASTDPFASAVRATRMPMLITDPRKPDNPIVFVNNAFLKLTGYERDECLGRNCRFLQGAGTNTADVALLRQKIAAREPVETDILNHRKDGSVFWNRVLVSPVFDEDGTLAFFFASQFDVTPERNRLDEVLRDRDSLEAEIERRIADVTRSEDRLRFTLKAGRLGSWTLDLETRQLVASALCKENFGRKPTDNFSYDDLIAAVHPDDFERWQQTVARAISDEEGELFVEYRAVIPNGEVRWIEVRGQVNRNSEGMPIGIAGVSIDITARKQTDEHRELLTRELDHRVKNTLANVQSIVSQTLRVAPSVEEGARILSSRLQALAMAQDVLVRNAWTSADLHDLVDEILRPFAMEGARRIKVNGPSLRIRSEIATTLTLALHELATNASKYGALSNENGEVKLEWKLTKGRPENFTLTWTEKGGPSVVAPTRKGFGSRLLSRALAKEIDGATRISYDAGGVVFCLEALRDAIEERAAD